MKHKEMKAITKIEQVAMILLKNKIEFTYESEYLKVLDQTVKYELFQTATYHSTTKKLVLMDGEYKEVTVEWMMNYFAK